MTFAKSRERLIAAVHVHLRMLRRRPVEAAVRAFCSILSAQTLVCGLWSIHAEQVGPTASVRPMSQRQRDDMVILAHIREQHRLSLESYGRPRMTEELQELGVNVGHPTARQWFACKP